MPLRPTETRGSMFFINPSMAMCRLAQLLDAGPSVYATDVPFCLPYSEGRLNTLALPSLEEMAASHVTLIRSGQFAGPYIVVGHSFSGLLAFEVAHQLSRENESVAIFLVDTWLSKLPVWIRLKELTWASARWSLASRLERLLSKAWRIAERLLPLSMSPQYPLTAADVPADQPMVDLPFEMRSHLRQAYRLRPLKNRGVLFCAQLNSHLEVLLAYSNRLIKLFAGGLEIVDTPGDHITLLKDPNIHVLAHKFDQCLIKYGYCHSNAPACPTDRKSETHDAKSVASSS